MPYKEHEITKKYFSISEILKMLENGTGYVIEASTLRFWERELELKIKRIKSTRRYTEADYHRLRIIATLRINYEFTIEGVKLLLNKRDHKKWLINFLLNNSLYNGKHK